VDAVERLTLEALATNSLEALEHVHRYSFAAELCEGSRVLDLCCGTGYGSRILRDACPVVVGIDKDEATVRLAQSMYGREAGIEFEAADALDVLEQRLPERFDAIVLLEGLEHLAQPRNALHALQQHASWGMKLVVSIPNSKTFGEENRFHLTDFGFDDAVEMCSRFDRATLVYQFLAEGSLLRTAQPAELEAKLLEEARGELEYANHLIICANIELAEDSPVKAHMQLATAPTHNRYMTDLERANDELRRTNARLAHERIGVANSAGATLLAKLKRAEIEVTTLRERLDEKERAEEEARELHAWIDHLHEEIGRYRSEVEAMQGSRAWRLAGRYWAVRDRLIGRRSG
jgi:2-polyprenyl-3-methyl-5-hydroxy-6-metoxy-1,4-benzoquinol methylase